VDADQVERRLVYAMLNEAAAACAEGVVRSARDGEIGALAVSRPGISVRSVLAALPVRTEARTVSFRGPGRGGGHLRARKIPSR
jgi:hypothetical protein